MPKILKNFKNSGKNRFQKFQNFNTTAITVAVETVVSGLITDPVKPKFVILVYSQLFSQNFQRQERHMSETVPMR